MQRPRFGHLLLKRQNQVLGQHGDSVFSALTIPYQDFPPLKFNIFDA